MTRLSLGLHRFLAVISRETPPFYGQQKARAIKTHKEIF